MRKMSILIALVVAAGCSGSPLKDGTYYVKGGKIGTLPDGPYYMTGGVPGKLPDGVYKMQAGEMFEFDPQTGRTAPVHPVPVQDPTTSLWAIIAMGVGAMVAGRLVGIAAAKIPFLEPVAPFLTAILGGSGFRPAVVTEQPKPPSVPPAA